MKQPIVIGHDLTHMADGPNVGDPDKLLNEVNAYLGENVNYEDVDTLVYVICMLIRAVHLYKSLYEAKK